LLSVVAASLVLTLQTGQIPAAGGPPAWAASVSTQEQITAPQLRSSLWRPAGAYGMAMTFAGGAGILTEYSTRKQLGRNIHPPMIGMGLGLLAGLVPGWLLGESSRVEENAKGRGAIGVLDLAGTAAVIFALRSIYQERN
jgi:hypothetical protein